MADPNSNITAWAVFSVIGGSIVGAIASASVSFIIQRRNLDAAKKQREDDRLQVRKALGYSLLFKMLKLSSNLENMGKALAENFERAKTKGLKGEPWQIVQAMVPKADDIHFSAEEMALVLSLEDKLYNDLAALDDVHNQTCALFEIYGQKRELALSRFSGRVDGGHVMALLTPEDLNWLAPRALELNSLVEMMRQRSSDDAKIAWDALVKLRNMLDAKLGIKHRLEHR